MINKSKATIKGGNDPEMMRGLFGDQVPADPSGPMPEKPKPIDPPHPVDRMKPGEKDRTREMFAGYGPGGNYLNPAPESIPPLSMDQEAILDPFPAGQGAALQSEWARFLAGEITDGKPRRDRLNAAGIDYGVWLAFKIAGADMADGIAAADRAKKAASGESEVTGDSRFAKDGRAIVVVNPDHHEQVREQVCGILGNAPGVRLYERAGRAVVVVDTDCRVEMRNPATGEAMKFGPKSRAIILPPGAGHMASILSKQIAFRREKAGKGRKKMIPADIPTRLPAMITDVPGGLKPLRGLLHGPTYHAATDTIISEVGYHPALAVELTAGVKLDVPAACTQADARAAAERILAIYRYFPWPDETSGGCLQRGRLLVAMVTALLRHEFGPAPLFMLRARMAGSGKTEISKSISEIVHGDQPRLMPWVTGRAADDEIRKRFAGLLDGGETFVLIDNVPAGWLVDSPTLNAVITSEKFHDRELGRNSSGRQVGGPNHLFVVLTGNNIAPSGDLGERTLPIDLEATAENHRRTSHAAFEGVGDLVPHIRKNRAAILADLMIILRAYQQAGRPEASTIFWGSFPQWHQACVQPVTFALGFDPLAGIHDQWHEHDEEEEALSLAMARWNLLEGGRSLTAAELKFRATGDQEWMNALGTLCGRDFSEINSRVLGRRLNAFKGRPVVVGGKRMTIRTTIDGHTKACTFRLAAFQEQPESPDAEFAVFAESLSHPTTSKQGSASTSVVDNGPFWGATVVKVTPHNSANSAGGGCFEFGAGESSGPYRSGF